MVPLLGSFSCGSFLHFSDFERILINRFCFVQSKGDVDQTGHGIDVIPAPCAIFYIDYDLLVVGIAGSAVISAAVTVTATVTTTVTATATIIAAVTVAAQWLQY